VVTEAQPIDHRPSKTGRWLRVRRRRIALWTAAVEAVLVWIFHDISQWTVIGLAIVATILYWFAGRHSRSDGFRQITWILAVSQLAAVLAVIVASVLAWTAIIVAILLAGLAFFFVFTDRR
jgi:uncharacterized membrane protein YbhN (UPF0104 family)